MKRRIVAIMLVLFTTMLFSQTTGVIRGVVLDEMGDPLPGANVVVKGTTWGAETDEDGYYYIIGVRAGTYTMKAEFIGFVPSEVQNVRVRVGLTTTQNFKLSTEIMELAEIGVEVAMEKKVEMDVTTSVRSIDMDNLERLSVTAVDDMLKQTTGIQTDADGELHFRGGRSGEVNYVIDGVSVGDPTGAKTNPVEINFANVESFNIQKGIPDAEYGDALSGSVNIVMKIGDQEKTSGHAKYATDTFFGDSKLNYDKGEFSLSGPIPLPVNGMKPTYYIATDFTLQDGYNRSYREQGDPDGEYFEFKDYDITGFGFKMPQRRENNFNIILKAAYDISMTQKLSLSYTKSRTNNHVFSHLYKYTPQTAGVTNADIDILNISWRHTIGQSSYY
ncbi:MAG: carboxypeptidase-like regulatory domain-containing protein, partial [Candidatus Delongbacteria bacterium]